MKIFLIVIALLVPIQKDSTISDRTPPTILVESVITTISVMSLNDALDYRDMVFFDEIDYFRGAKVSRITIYEVKIGTATWKIENMKEVEGLY